MGGFSAAAVDAGLLSVVGVGGTIIDKNAGKGEGGDGRRNGGSRGRGGGSSNELSQED